MHGSFPKNPADLLTARKMLHDPETYSRPFEFNPDRFLPGDGREPEQDPRGEQFGLHKTPCYFILTMSWTDLVFGLGKR